MTRKPGTIFMAALLVISSLGCARQLGQYEERYRIFFAAGPIDAVRITDSADTIASSFEPRLAVETALEKFASDDFGLTSISPMPWGRGAAIFVFRKNISAGEGRTRSSLHYTGAYQTSGTGSGGATTYVISPELRGYRVQIVGAAGVRTFSAELTEKELKWQDGNQEYRALLSQDGRSISISAGAGESVAFRLAVPRRSTVLERRAQPFLQNLRPQTRGL